jgi:hypothetical protein
MPRSKRQVDETLIAALAFGATVENAARTAGISVRTAHRRMRDAKFKRQLQAFKADIVQRTTGMLSSASLEAGKTLIRLQDASVSPQVQLGAARATLEFGIKFRENLEVEQRLAALEQVIKQGINHGSQTPSSQTPLVREHDSETTENSSARSEAPDSPT